MEEIDLRELFEYVMKKIGMIIMITAAVCILGCFYALFIQKPMYKSYTTVVLSSSEGNSSSITQNDVNLNKNLVNTYAEIIKSRRILDQVIDELKLDTSYESLSSRISVSALNDTEIIKITISDSDPKVAKDVANSAAKVFAKEIVSIYNMNNVSILDKAIQNKTPYNINLTKQLILYFAIGIVLSFGIVFIIFYFDRTIKSVEQIEQKVKLPILGTVQDISKGGKK